MKNEKDKSIIVKKPNYIHKKYSSPAINKLVQTTYYNYYFSPNKSKENINIFKTPSKSNLNYKDPIFLNENSLNTQLNILRKLSFDNNHIKYNESHKLNISYDDNKKLPKLKRNNTENLNVKLKIDKVNNNKDNKYLTFKRTSIFFSRFNTDSNINNESIKNSQEYSPEKLYKIIFKSKHPHHKDLKPIIENKYNMKYSENEEQYKFIIEKEYMKNILKGKRVKSKNVCPYIKVKLDDAQNKIKFMKDIIDYSYPLFVLSKIKVKQKNLKEMKKQMNKRYFKYIGEKERRLNEIKIRNANRTQYLLKSFSIFK